MEIIKNTIRSIQNEPRAVMITLAVVLFGYTITKFIGVWNRRSRHRRHLEKAKSVRQERDLKIEEFLKENQHKVSGDKQRLIIESDVTTLCKLIKEQKVTAVEALITYAIRAGTVGKEYGWICDINFSNALREAELADEKIRNKQELGPLHGIPVSIKDNIAFKGMRTTAGFISKHNNISKTDSLFVKILKQKGAIPFVVSNIPQGGMALESSNALWGISRNPWNRNKGVGGSSGGEAGLVAGRCSPIGIGNDIGGSIRVPSAFCGCYSLKPTSSRISKVGFVSYTDSAEAGFQNVNVSWGPIARSIDDVVLLTQNIFGEFSDDETVNNKPFDYASFNREINNNKRPIKIGYLLETELMETAPEIKEAMNDIIKNLKGKGFIMEEFPISKLNELIDTGLCLLLNSGFMEFCSKTVDGEDIAPYYKDLEVAISIGKSGRRIASTIFSLLGEKRHAKVLDSFINLDRFGYIEYSKRFAELKSECYAFIKENKFDALISPVFPTPAIDLDLSKEFVPFNHFAFLYNFLDLPSGTVPITLSKNTPYESKINDRYTTLIKNSMKTADKLPIVIQIGALPQQDEFVLRLMKEVDTFYRYDLNCGNKVLEVMDSKK